MNASTVEASYAVSCGGFMLGLFFHVHHGHQVAFGLLDSSIFSYL